MVISDNPALLFIHIPKNAGSSVIELMAPEGRRDHPLCQPRGKHETISALRERVGREVLGRYHTFCIVRDPLERFVSHYRWLRDHTHRLPEMAGIRSLDDYARTFGDEHARLPKPARYATQSDFVRLDGGLGVDSVLRFEGLPTALLRFLATHGMHRSTLPRVNRSQTPPPTASAFVRSFVADYYAEDYRRFGYVPPTSSSPGAHGVPIAAESAPDRSL